MSKFTHTNNRTYVKYPQALIHKVIHIYTQHQTQPNSIKLNQTQPNPIKLNQITPKSITKFNQNLPQKTQQPHTPLSTKIPLKNYHCTLTNSLTITHHPTITSLTPANPLQQLTPHPHYPKIFTYQHRHRPYLPVSPTIPTQTYLYFVISI